MSDKFILRGKEVVSCDDLELWAQWFQTANRRVAHDTVGDVRISTVFLGLNHNFFDDGPPLIFETMVFGGQLDDATERYSTYAQAESGHAAMVERVKATLQ